MILDPTFKAKWLEALRSGKFKQGKRRLCQKNTDDQFEHCCLGVACEVLNIPKEPCDVGSNNYKFTESNLYGTVYLGNLDMKYSELKPLQNDKIYSKLANMNDNGKSFDEIANWIEENL